MLSLLFPHTCAACQSDLPGPDNELCSSCLLNLPETGFTGMPDNPVEKLFWGRLPLRSGTGLLYFNKGGMVQSLLHEIKYRSNKKLAIQLGRLLGRELLLRGDIHQVEGLLPLPLFPRKEKQRGYNQSELLCEGIAMETGLPVWAHILSRPEHTETQTRKGRLERWKNIEGKFFLKDPEAIQNKSLLLVDDVVTTGATLDSCGNEILRAGNVKLHVAVLAIAGH